MKYARFTTALAAAGTLVLATPTGAHAGAIGSTPVRTFEYSVGGVTMKVPTGCMFTHAIRGSGRKITYQNAGVDCAFVGARRRRQAGIAAFIVGLVVSLAFFAFFPGLPHVIDWGAILVSLAVGGLARWGCQSWITRTAKQRPERM